MTNATPMDRLREMARNYLAYEAPGSTHGEELVKALLAALDVVEAAEDAVRYWCHGDVQKDLTLQEKLSAFRKLVESQA